MIDLRGVLEVSKDAAALFRLEEEAHAAAIVPVAVLQGNVSELIEAHDLAEFAGIHCILVRFHDVFFGHLGGAVQKLVIRELIGMTVYVLNEFFPINAVNRKAYGMRLHNVAVYANHLASGLRGEIAFAGAVDNDLALYIVTPVNAFNGNAGNGVAVLESADDERIHKHYYAGFLEHIVCHKTPPFGIKVGEGVRAGDTVTGALVGQGMSRHVKAVMSFLNDTLGILLTVAVEKTCIGESRRAGKGELTADNAALFNKQRLCAVSCCGNSCRKAGGTAAADYYIVLNIVTVHNFPFLEQFGYSIYIFLFFTFF